MAAPFEPTIDPFAPGSGRGRLGRSIGLVAGIAVVTAIAVVIWTTVAGSAESRYRVATAANADVAATINAVEAIEPVTSATVAFPSAGKVQSVNVSLGSAVTAGQSLASLDPNALQNTLHQRQATLANAELTLSKALDAQTAAADAAAAVEAAAADAATSTTSTAVPGGGGSLTSQIVAAQRQVTSAQRQADAAITTANTKVALATTACAASPLVIVTCQTALAAVTTAQASVQTAQQTLATSMTALDALLRQQAAAGGSSSGSGGGGSPVTTVPGSTTGGASRTGGPTAAVPTAADIASDQAAVDSAQQAVTVAEQAIAQSTISSPINGTVVQVTIVAGQSVSAASTTATIVIAATGGFESSLTLSVDQIPKVRVGQAATVLPDGFDHVLRGQVAQIAIQPTTTNGTATYRVIIALSDQPAELRNGSIGTASIIIATAKNALSVPTSAVHVDGATRTVNVLNGSTVTSTEVQVGIVGTDLTQITSGLESGAKVVLADLHEPLPGSATKSSSSTSNQIRLPNGQVISGTTGGATPGGANFGGATGGANFGGGGARPGG
ncbi:MAG: biotin/lipoyl-binding protein [Actinobacteria bacterium]|nr:biotin/lipoyl-binding protein [Actinomycetota bacterium]